jgi:hypothetical protein
MQGLRERGNGNRESGAFLLGPQEKPRLISEFVLYDDLDPDCLTGGITFHGAGYNQLSELCRQRNLRVHADVHTHPTDFVQQSSIDSTHPMIARDGHLALIVPSYGQTRGRPSEIGLHRYRSDNGWDTWSGHEVERRIYVGRWP